MKQKIEQLSRGIFEYQLPDILISVEIIQITAVAGSTYHGCFTISNSRGSRMKGVLYSSSRLFVLPNDKFIGEENCINYHFAADYLDPGETITGEIGVISDCGETLIPFEVKIVPPFCESSIGVIKDLFHFTNLAKTDWEEAVSLFQSKEFANALKYYEPKMQLLYQHLMEGTSADQALEEFLVTIRKKLSITLTTDKAELEYTAGEYSFLDKVVLTTNTWGYTKLKIYSDVEFLRPTQTEVKTTSFAANQYEVGFVIEPERMHAGVNSGCLYIEGIHQRIVIPVTCRCKGRDAVTSVKRRRIRQYDKKIVQNYIRFRLNKISTGKYINEAENLLLGLSNAEGAAGPERELYQVHLLLAEGKETQAKSIMERYEEQASQYKKQPVIFAAILYLSALCKKQQEENDRTCVMIRELYQSNPEQWMLLWFLLYMDKSYTYTPEKKLEDIRTAFYQGCRSPILYYEAVAAINETPANLSSLKLFELQVMAFAVRYQALTKEAALRLAYLASPEPYNALLLRVLAGTYGRFHEKELLTAICNCLIQGQQYGKLALPWYTLAVKNQPKLQGLPEYYLLSIQDDITFPMEHAVLTYFAYNTELADEQKAYLYANVITHKDAYSFIYKSYEKQIEEFTLQMLENGRINRNMAVLYDAVLPNIAMTSKLAEHFTDICFYFEIECSHPAMAGVYVIHKEMNREIYVPFQQKLSLNSQKPASILQKPVLNSQKPASTSQKHTYIEMFTENAEVLLVDEDGNRYLSTVDYTLNKLVHLESMFELCDELAGDNPKLLLNLAEKAQYYQKRDEGTIELRKRVTRIPELNSDYVRDYVKGLIYYYYENYEGELLESYLLQIDLKTLERAERIRMIEFMIVRDLYNVALKAMDEYGFEGIDGKRLQKLCSRLLLNAGGMEKVDVLVAACAYVFQEGKYDEVILGYLTDYYYGTTAGMFEIWKAARTFDIDTLDLEERLLGQMLFAESYISNTRAVFSNYYRNGTNKKLIRAYLSYFAYKYLLNDRLVEQEIFDIMRKEINYEENELCLLAVLKWYSTKEQLTDAEVNFVDHHLYRLELNGIILPFFREFKGSMRIPQSIYDKYYVEYRTDPKKKVTIHYSFEDESSTGGYVQETMRNVCYGIFVKEFVLFCNESLQYYITEEGEDGPVITESREIRLAPEQTGSEDTKYYQLNLIITAREMQDEKTALKLLENYIRTDYAISQLFHPL